MNTGFEALKRAVKKFGGPTAAARAFGLAQQSVSRKLKTGGDVPAEWCLAIERATDGEITRHDLRPDIYPVGETTQ